MRAFGSEKVPFVLAGSIRDDGPLPDTITDALVAQGAMRVHTNKATMVVMVATALHSIAVGNMLSTYQQSDDGTIREITTICVDQTEFVVSKLKDRGHTPSVWGGHECPRFHALDTTGTVSNEVGGVNCLVILVSMLLLLGIFQHT